MTIALLVKITGIAATLAVLAWFLLHVLRTAGRCNWLIVLPALGGLCAMGFYGLVSEPDTGGSKPSPADKPAATGGENSPYREADAQLPPDQAAASQTEGKKPSLPPMDEGAALLEKNPKCGKVKWRDVSIDASTDKQQVFFYICAPSHNVLLQVLVSEEEIKNASRNGHPVQIVEPLGEAKALEACNHWIDMHTRGWSRHEIVSYVIHAYANGKTLVKRKFWRKGKAGQETAYAVNCLVAPSGIVTGQMTQR